MESLSNGFLRYGNINGTILAIDGTHMPIRRPKVNGTNYYNRKIFYSLNVLALVDHNKKFIFLSNGYECNHDMRVYRNSDNIQNFVEGIPPGFFIVGDKAYRAVVNLRVPETNRGIDDYTAHQLGKQKISVENSFGLLKGKFRL